MAFDPDAYLASAPAPSGGFDPDEYLKKKEAEAQPQPALGTGYFGRKVQEQMDDPYSMRSTIGRVATGIVGGIPDLAIKFQNAGLNPFDYVGKGVDYVLGTDTQPKGRLPEITPLLRKATGTPELPEDASTARGLLEGAAQVAGSGGARGVGQAIQNAPTALAAIRPAAAAATRNIVAPVIGSTVGGEVGGAIGGEKGALIGGLAGGLAPAARVMRQAATRAGARPDAPDIAAAAERQNVPTTAGMLGDLNVQAQERQLSGRPGAVDVISGARQSTQAGLRDAVQRAIEQRQALPGATPTTTDIHGVATQARAAGTDASNAAQARLMERVGPQAPVDVAPVLAEMERVARSTDPGTAAPIVARVQHLRDMLPRDQQGNITGTTVAYERFKDWRSALGKRLSGGIDPIQARHSRPIYDTATTAMRETATRSGVHPDEFNLAQDITRNQMRAGEITDVYDRSLGNTMAEAAGPRKFAAWWQGLSPQEQTAIAGGQRGNLADVARLAEAFNYPTSQTGLTRAFGGQLAELPARAVGAGLGGLLGNVLGIPGGTTIGAAIGSYGTQPINYLRARMLEGQGRRRNMLRDVRPVGIDELRGVLTNIGARQ